MRAISTPASAWLGGRGSVFGLCMLALVLAASAAVADAQVHLAPSANNGLTYTLDAAPGMRVGEAINAMRCDVELTISPPPQLAPLHMCGRSTSRADCAQMPSSTTTRPRWQAAAPPATPARRRAPDGRCFAPAPTPSASSRLCPAAPCPRPSSPPAPPSPSSRATCADAAPWRVRTRTRTRVATIY